MKYLLLLVAAVLCLFGAIFIIGGVANLMEPRGDQSAVAYLLATLFLGVAPFGAGLWLVGHVRKKAKSESRELRERMVLELAKERGGPLTVAEVARSTSLSSAEAKELLDQCHLNQLAEMHVSDSGAVIYTFRGVGPAEGE